MKLGQFYNSKTESSNYSVQNGLDIIPIVSKKRSRSNITTRKSPPTNIPTTVPAAKRAKLSYDPKVHSNQQYLENAAKLQSKNDFDSDKKPAGRRKNHEAIERYEREKLGIDPRKSTPAGKLDTCTGTCPSLYINDCIDMTKSGGDEIDEKWSYEANAEAKALANEAEVPTVTELFNGGFGKPSKNHSFTQEASFETVALIVLKSGYLCDFAKAKFALLHPLLRHMTNMLPIYSKIDFSPLKEYDPNYNSQQSISRDKVKMLMACLFHYDLDVSNVMRYLGNNYTGEYREIESMVERMRGLVDDDLLAQYIRVMTVGAPAHFVAESTRENALLHWREGNHKSIALNLEKIQRSMNKLDKHNFVIPLHSWIARYIPHIFFTPQHLLQKHGKDDRLIYDASRRFTPTSVPVNRMTSTRFGVELDCEYGSVLSRLLVRIWNLRITYPDKDIILHANDVKSCFRQIKHHPDVMGAFSYIIADILYLSCGLTFGSDFSPQSWEVPRRMAEQLGTKLYEDDTLVEKHRQYLDQLKWSKKLGDKQAKLVPAHATEKYQGVLNEKGEHSNTPHHLFVDDDVYAEIYDITRVERTIAAGIESIFRILGESDLDKRQDPISWDKLYDMIVHFINKILGQIINTREMTVETPPEFIAKVVKLLENTWHAGNRTRQAFEVKEAENLAGLLAHISSTAPWLKHMMSHVYTSLAASLKSNQSYLVNTNKHFRNQLKVAKDDAFNEEDEMRKSFAQAETSRKVHNLKRKHRIVDTLYDELAIIYQALKDDTVSKAIPIAHLIPGLVDATAHGDSSLDSAGGWSEDMQFIWWLDWPEEIRARTLRHVKDGKSGKLIDINSLEYATVLINYAASIYFWIMDNNISKKNIPYPNVLIMADNTSSESWATKGCKRSMIGRRLGRLQCAMMINNPVGLDSGHVDTKTNVIADRISRWKTQTDTLLGFDKLIQEYPQLQSCRRFHPSKYLISLITEALLSEKLKDPLSVSQELLRDPGRVSSWNTAHEQV